MIEIYTDGSCRASEGYSGGLGVYVPAWDIRLAVAQTNVTNNRMELGAIYLGMLVAFEHANKGDSVCIVSDSRYSLDSVFTWWRGWERNGFKTKKGEVKNLTLLKSIQVVYRDLQQLGVKVTSRWVKGHSGDAGNEEADRLSNWRAPRMRGCYALAHPSPVLSDEPALLVSPISFGTDLTEQDYYPLLDALAASRCA